MIKYLWKLQSNGEWFAQKVKAILWCKVQIGRPLGSSRGTTGHSHFIRRSSKVYEMLGGAALSTLQRSGYWCFFKWDVQTTVFDGPPVYGKWDVRNAVCKIFQVIIRVTQYYRWSEVDINALTGLTKDHFWREENLLKWKIFLISEKVTVRLNDLLTR